MIRSYGFLFVRWINSNQLIFIIKNNNISLITVEFLSNNIRKNNSLVIFYYRETVEFLSNKIVKKLTLKSDFKY